MSNYPPQGNYAPQGNVQPQNGQPNPQGYPQVAPQPTQTGLNQGAPRVPLAPSQGNSLAPTANQNDPNIQRDRLGKSLNTLNNTWLDENSVRGDGANVISDRLNFGNRKQVEGPPQIIYVPKPVSKVVYEDVVVDSPSVVDDSLNNNARSIVAESQAKIALLLMENNRLRWLVSQRNQELTRLRSAPVVTRVEPVVTKIVQPVTQVTQVIQAPPSCPTCLRPFPHGWTGPGLTTTTGTVVRTSGGYTTSTVAPSVVRTSNQITTVQPTVVRTSNPVTTVQPSTTYRPATNTTTGTTYTTSSTTVAPATTSTYNTNAGYTTSTIAPAGTTTYGNNTGYTTSTVAPSTTTYTNNAGYTSSNANLQPSTTTTQGGNTTTVRPNSSSQTTFASQVPPANTSQPRQN